MPNFAVIKNNIVDNVIVADTKEIAESITSLLCVEIPVEPGAPGIGWVYNETGFVTPAPIVIDNI